MFLRNSGSSSSREFCRLAKQTDNILRRRQPLTFLPLGDVAAAAAAAELELCRAAKSLFVDMKLRQRQQEDVRGKQTFNLRKLPLGSLQQQHNSSGVVAGAARAAVAILGAGNVNDLHATEQQQLHLFFSLSFLY